MRVSTAEGDMSWLWVALSQGFGYADADKVEKEETGWVPAPISICFLVVNSVWPATCCSRCHTTTVLPSNVSWHDELFSESVNQVTHFFTRVAFAEKFSIAMRKMSNKKTLKQMQAKTSKWQPCIEYTTVWLGAQRKHLAQAKVEAHRTKALSWITTLPQNLNSS